MHHIVLIAATAALLGAALLQCARASHVLNTMDNEISVNDPIPNNGLRFFVDIKKTPSPARHLAGTITELTCEAAGHPAPRIQWLKNDMPILEEELENNEIIETSDSSMAVVTSILQIIATSSAKEDAYTCVAQAGLHTAFATTQVYNDIDPLAPMFSSIASLNRHVLSASRKPRITEFSKTYLGDINSVLVLPCRATGNPMPEITWRDHSDRLIDNTNPRIKVLESGELMFAPALWSDMGDYKCTATNAVGSESVNTFLYPVIAENQKSKYRRIRN